MNTERTTAKAANVGPTCQPVWFAYLDGEMLRDKRGVGRRFKTETAALAAARAKMERDQ